MDTWKICLLVRVYPPPPNTHKTHCIGLSNHMWFSTSKILFMNTQNTESCTSSDRTTQRFSNHLWSLCKWRAKVNDQFCFHWKYHHQPDFQKQRNQSNPTMLSCVSATLKWAQWGWKSCVSCSATGMEPALSARARWDWSRLQKKPNPKVFLIIFRIVLPCSKCKQTSCLPSHTCCVFRLSDLSGWVSLQACEVECGSVFSP